MAGYSVDPAELGRSSAGALRAGQSLTGSGPLVGEVDRAAPAFAEPGVIERALTIADSAGRLFTEGTAVLNALSTGLRYAAEHYDATDKDVYTATPVPEAAPVYV